MSCDTKQSRGTLHGPEGEMVELPDIFTCVRERSLWKTYITLKNKKKRKLSIGVLSAKYHID